MRAAVSVAQTAHAVAARSFCVGPATHELLAATQQTSVQLGSIGGMTSSWVYEPCSWQQLEVTASMSCHAAAYLPPHALTQPFTMGRLCIRIADVASLCAHPRRKEKLHGLTVTSPRMQ